MYRYVSGMFEGDLLDQRTVLIKVLSSRTAFTIYGDPTVIEVGYLYGKSSEILLHEYVHDFLYALHPDSKEEAEEDYGAISEAIPDFLAADHTSHSVFGGPAPNSEATMRDQNIVWRKLNRAASGRQIAQRRTPNRRSEIRALDGHIGCALGYSRRYYGKRKWDPNVVAHGVYCRDFRPRGRRTYDFFPNGRWLRFRY